jgi:PAS domain S-box-containing protein
MPLSSAFESHRFVEHAQRVRKNPIAAYGVAVLAVAVATAARWGIGSYTMEGTPFITYYPAIVIVALIGGFWPGVLATVSSAILAWFAFISPSFSLNLTQPELISLLLFIFIAGVNVVLVALLNIGIERIIAQEKNTRILLESAPNGIVLVDERGIIKLVNASAEKLFGYDRTELMGRGVEILVPAPQSAAHRYLRESFQMRPETRAMGAGRDLSGRRKDGSEFSVEIGLNPVSRNGSIAVLATVIDISERKRAVERQQFLVRELRHRSQNLFAVIQSIAARSLAEGQTLAEAKEVFGGRLAALARTHAMLADAAWEGAPLAEIFQQELAGFAKHVKVSGCDIIINTPAAQQFALIAHELTTNAVKYGALSASGGQVVIEGKVERSNGESSFALVWKEIGGPPVTVPTRKGFGSVILLDAAKQFGEHVALKYDSQGVVYELRLSLNAIEAPKKRDGHWLGDAKAG